MNKLSSTSSIASSYNRGIAGSYDDGRVEVSKELPQADADKEAKNVDGYTPLHLAAYNGQVEVLKELPHELPHVGGAGAQTDGGGG